MAKDLDVPGLLLTVRITDTFARTFGMSIIVVDSVSVSNSHHLWMLFLANKLKYFSIMKLTDALLYSN